MFDSSRNGAAVSLGTQPNGAAATSKLASRTNGSVQEESEHFVQFYETNAFLLDSLRDFIQARTRGELESRASVALADDATGTSLSPTDWLQPWRFLRKSEESTDSKGALQTQPRSGYWTAGYVSMVVGAILVPVPLIPGIPLLILASYFFAKASTSKASDGPEVSEQAPNTKE